MTDHLPGLVTSLAAPCAQLGSSQTPHWIQIVQAAGGIATTIGVLTALYVVVFRDPREASQEHKHHLEQMAAIQRAKTEHFVAQARKLVPSCVRTPLLGDTWWAVRIENASTKVTTILDVDVTAIDANGLEVPGGCRPTTNTMLADHAFDRSVRAALSDSLESALERPVTDAIKQAIRDAVAVHFVNRWPHTMPPTQHAVMSYTTTDPKYKLRVTIEYEDETGFQWRRSDTGQPVRVDEVGEVNPVLANVSWSRWDSL
jgi:hypothetical protein